MTAKQSTAVRYWYFITTYECPICGRTNEIRERCEGPRPEGWSERHEFVTDACGEHFC